MIVGTAENVSGGPLDYVQIQANFYNRNDVKVGSAMGNTNNLAAGAKWRFELMAMSMDTSNFDSYRIASVSAY
jgi:hypothetical protein